MTWTRSLEIDLDLPEDEGEENRDSRSARERLRDEENTLRWVSRAAWTILLLALAVFLVRGADRTMRPKLIPAGGRVPSHTVRGFDEVGFTITGPKIPPEHRNDKHCALLADTEAKRERGLMNRRDLGGYEAMVFLFPTPILTPFYMKDTVIPLSIAWFSPNGVFLTSRNMLPCATAANCQLFYSSAPYTTAIEVEQGYLPTLRVGPGTTIDVGGPCTQLAGG